MNKTAFAVLFVLGSGLSGLAAQEAPRMEKVVESPADYAGKTLTFSGAKLSGAIVKYDVSGVRKYYLTVSSASRDLEAGFFLAPPALADKLADKMDPRKSYAVKITCKVEKLVINEVPQWHGIVTQVDFVDGDGRVTDTVKLEKK
jgi:hypothetical protein